MSAGRGIRAAVTVVVAVIALAACAPTPDPAATTPPPAVETAAPPEATSEPTASATAAAEATCASLLPPATVSDFEEIGWTAREEPFYAGAVELADGLQCTWGDYSVATDHVQIFGWAPISAEQSDTARDELLSSGWHGEEGAEGVYITESSETTIATDADGYGITYLFGDGWVMVADTKQGLLLIERPQS